MEERGLAVWGWHCWARVGVGKGILFVALCKGDDFKHDGKDLLWIV